jgi:urease accessory protein UreE
MSSNCYIP